jgi:hypothetical protein
MDKILEGFDPLEMGAEKKQVERSTANSKVCHCADQIQYNATERS